VEDGPVGLVLVEVAVREKGEELEVAPEG